jgi:hypothetical protein
MRYLGGGIGHLEQFPPASNDDGHAAAHEDSDEDIEEIDEDNAVGGPESIGDSGDDNGNRGTECVEKGESEDEDEDEDDLEVDDPGPGESSDEETGNVY